MFDQSWEESPTIQRMREKYRVQGLQEGRQEGELLALLHMLVNVVRTRYPPEKDQR